MGENFLSIIVTITFFVLMAYLIFKGRQRRSEHSRETIQHGSGRPGNQRNANEAMAEFNSHLEHLQALAQSQEGATHEPQAHVVKILSAIQTQLVDLDKRIKVFEKEAEAFKKSHVGLENP